MSNIKVDNKEKNIVAKNKTFFATLLLWNKLLWNNKFIIIAAVVFSSLTLLGLIRFGTQIPSSSIYQPYQPETIYGWYIEIFFTLPILISFYLVMFSISIIFNKIIDTSVYSLIKKEGKSFKFLLHNFIVALAYSTIVLVSLSMAASIFELFYTREWIFTFNIINIIKYIIYGMLVLSFSISISMLISSSKYEYGTRIIMIVIFAFVTMIFSKIFWLYALFDKLYYDPDYFQTHTFKAIILLIPFIIWFFVINPISFSLLISQFIYSSQFLNYQIHLNYYESYKWIWYLLLSINIIEVVSLTPLILFYANYRLMRR